MKSYYIVLLCNVLHPCNIVIVYRRLTKANHGSLKKDIFFLRAGYASLGLSVVFWLDTSKTRASHTYLSQYTWSTLFSLP